MRHFLGSGLLAAALLAGSVFSQSPATTGTATTIYNFDTLAGSGPTVPVNDGFGGFIGVTSGGGTNKEGVVYHLTPNGDGTFSDTTIHEFGSGVDGREPLADLVYGPFGVLYGTTTSGGTFGQGTIFSLTPNGDGTWTEAVIWNFAGPPNDGGNAFSPVTFDSLGNMWGTTIAGGKYSSGALFEMTPNQDGTWSEQILYNFSPRGAGGWGPRGKLAIDSLDNLYGEAVLGGKYPNGGTVFKWSQNPEGGGIYTPLHQFGATADGAEPAGGLVIDASGNLFGTTMAGGRTQSGTIFEIAAVKGGGYTYKLLVNFMQKESPTGLMISDNAGGFYGVAPTASAKSTTASYVFHLTQSSNVWTAARFSGLGGGFGGSSVMWGQDGKLYGPASGGSKFAGTVYQVKLN